MLLRLTWLLLQKDLRVAARSREVIGFMLLFALLFIVDEDKRTLPVGLVRFYGYHSTDYALVFAALAITTVPILVLYFILQKHVIAGLSATAMD